MQTNASLFVLNTEPGLNRTPLSPFYNPGSAPELSPTIIMYNSLALTEFIDSLIRVIIITSTSSQTNLQVQELVLYRESVVYRVYMLFSYQWATGSAVLTLWPWYTKEQSPHHVVVCVWSFLAVPPTSAC